MQVVLYYTYKCIVDTARLQSSPYAVRCIIHINVWQIQPV